MRVLTTTMCYPTSARPEQGVFIQRRASALAACGRAEVQVVSPQPWCPVLRDSARLSDQTWPLPVTFPRMLSVPVVSWATDGWAFARALEHQVTVAGGADRYDLIDAHFEYPDGVGAWLAARRLGLPVVVTVRGKIVSLSRKAIRRAQIARMLRGVDARIAVSRSLAAWVHCIGGSDLSVDVIPNGIEPATFHMLDRAPARCELGWSAEARYVLCVGHLQKVKGFDRIVSVLPDIRARLGDVRLVLAGSSRGEWRFRHRLRRLMASCGGAPAVSFIGAADPDRLNLMYNAADLFVNVSRSEGWNNAIGEALAAGTPVVAYDVGGNAEQICSPQLGRVVPDGHAAGLVDAVCGGLQAEWNRILISAHGGARGWSQVGREVYRVFDRVLQARASSANDAAINLFGLHLSAADVLGGSARRSHVGAVK